MLTMNRTQVRVLGIAVLVGAGVFLLVYEFSGVRAVEARAKGCIESGGMKMHCFTELIGQELARGGLSAAFDALSYLYDFDREFASVCHGNAHELGDAAYRLFQNGTPPDVSPKLSYCGYGFFHGFMERLIATEGTAERGTTFCSQVGEALRGETADAEGACLHGIGHGAVDGSFPSAWGNPEAMLAPGIDLCTETLGTTTIGVADFGPLYRCVTGSYNALEILSQDARYQLSQLTDNPLRFCRTQEPSYRPACYTNMLPILLRQQSDEIPPIVAAIDALPDEWGGYSMRRSIVADLTHEFIRLNLNDTDLPLAALSLCRTVPEEYRLACIEGIAGGFLKYGPPEREYEGALAFCGAGALRPDERHACFSYVLPRLRNFYSQEKSRSICAQAPEDVARVYCEAYE